MTDSLNAWQHFIKTQSIAPLSLQQVQKPTPSWFCDLSQWELLSVKGIDASKFLQGQISCDVSLVTKDQSQLAACVNLKGRIITNFIVHQMSEQHFVLLCPPHTAEITSKTLKKYAIFSKVSINTENDLALAAGQNINADLSQLQTLNVSALNFQFYLGSISEMQSLWLSSQTLGLSLHSQFFDYQVIQHALAFISPPCSEIFTPQEINFELVNGISFKKGCYTGQEVVARLHYRGKAKRRCYIAELHLVDKSDISASSEIKDTLNKSQGHMLQSLRLEAVSFSLISLSIQSFDAFQQDAASNALHIVDNKSIFTHLHAAPYPMSLS